MQTGYESQMKTDSYGDTYVRFWSVYNQVWTKAYSQSEIPDAEWAAQGEADRELFDRLPK